MLSASQWTSSNLTVGCKGDRGLVGDVGPSGPAGKVGPSGPSGIAGVSGPSGPSGVSGDSSLVGPSGPAGTLTSRISFFVGRDNAVSLTITSSMLYGILIISPGSYAPILTIRQSGLSSGNWMMLKNCSQSSASLTISGKIYTIPPATDYASPLYYVYYDGSSLYLY